MSSVLDSFAEYRLVPSVDGFIAPTELWFAMLGFASGAFYLPLERHAQGQFNCSPNGIALTLFAEYARAAYHPSQGSADSPRTEPPLAAQHSERAKWRALWPVFVAMIEAFLDSYKRRGGPRTLAELRATAKRQGDTPWSIDSCERARDHYTRMTEAELLAHWKRLLQAMNRDAVTNP